MPNLETRRWRLAQFEEFRAQPKAELPKNIRVSSIHRDITTALNNYLWFTGASDQELKNHQLSEIEAASLELAEILSDTVRDTLSLLKIADEAEVRLVFLSQDEYAKTTHISLTREREWCDATKSWYTAHQINISVWTLKEYILAVLNQEYAQVISLRGAIAHEIYHVYTTIHYQVATESCIKANQARRNGDWNPYTLDFGERAASLFEMQYLYYLSEHPALCKEAKAAYQAEIASNTYYLEKTLEMARNAPKKKSRRWLWRRQKAA